MERNTGIALNYMTRFRCTGPDCPSNCCTDWRFDVDERSYLRLKAVMLKEPAFRDLFRRGIRKDAGRGGRRAPYHLAADAQGRCVFQDDRRICRIHAELGERFLPVVCSTYPRSLQRVGDSWELTGHVSCWEVARLLLCFEDAVDPVPFERSMMPRKLVLGRMDPRDVRPYWRLLPEVRAFVLSLLTKPHLSLEHRLLAVTWFAHRTASVLRRDLMEGDVDLVRREIRALEDEAFLDELSRRFDELRTPSALVFLLVREILMAGSTAQKRRGFLDMVKAAFATYGAADGIAALRDRGPDLDTVLTQRVWEEFQSRKAVVRRRAGARYDLYQRNFAFHSWVHRLHLKAPDVMVYTLRFLTQLAVVKFLLLGDPRVAAAVRDVTLSDAAFGAVLDRVAIDVFSEVGRFIEHSQLLERLEKMLDLRKLGSFAGAVYLIRL